MSQYRNNWLFNSESFPAPQEPPSTAPPIYPTQLSHSGFAKGTAITTSAFTCTAAQGLGLSYTESPFKPHLKLLISKY